MTVEHKDIPEAGLHEPKGVSTATSKQVYAADGAGSGVWEDPEIVGQDASIIGEVPFSDGAGGVDWRVGLAKTTLLLNAIDLTDQLPTTLDVPIQVSFGGLQTTTDFDLSAAGDLTCNTTGTYFFTWNFRFARTSGTGTAFIVLRFTLNGSQIGNSLAAGIAGATDTFPFSLSTTLPLTAADVLKIEIVRDGAGNNDGGLKTFSPSLGTWLGAASAGMRIDKWELV